jgi:hypothetical protein
MTKKSDAGGRLSRAIVVISAVALVLTMGVPFAVAATPIASADFGGTATATILHADALQQSTTRVVNADVAFSGATVDSKGIATPLLNEMTRPVQPALAGKFSYGRGTGLEVGLGIKPDGEPNVVTLPGKVEASALPSTDLQTKEVLKQTISPVAFASVLRGQAQARWLAGNDCILGADLSRGLGYAADVQLVGTGTVPAGQEGLGNPLVSADAPSPDRAVSQSFSHTTLVRQVAKDGKTLLGPDFGLMSETRMTIAPITLFKGTANQLTIEVAGEWVLRAVATGLPTGGYVFYGPADVSPQTPLLRTINASGQVTNILTSQAIFGAKGLVVPIPNVAEIVIGEPPRAIGGATGSNPLESADGTSAAGAVDVVRVKLLEQKDSSGNVTARAADIRVGHAEVTARVPAGGISCSIPVTKVATPATTFVNQDFTTTITITNPFDCDLKDVSLVDDVTTKGGARFQVKSSTPPADSAPTGSNLASGTVKWNNLGVIKKGDSKSVSVVFTAQGAAGQIIDIATASGVLDNCSGSVTGTVVTGINIGSVAGAAITGVSKPLVVPVGAVLGTQLARTGAPAPTVVFAGFALTALAALGLRRARRMA